MEAAARVKNGELDYFIGACNTGAGAALSIAIAIIGFNKCCTIAKPGIRAKEEQITKWVAEGKVALAFPSSMSSMRSRCWFGNCHKEAKMDHILSVILVSLLTGMTALLSHRSAAVFHDGIRPILPQLVEGHMNRREAGSIAFGLSIGFVASVGISFTLSTGLLNSWLLFLPTDIIGVLAVNVWLAFILGAIWGILVFTSLQPINQLLTSLPVDIIGALGN